MPVVVVSLCAKGNIGCQGCDDLIQEPEDSHMDTVADFLRGALLFSCPWVGVDDGQQCIHDKISFTI